MVTRRLKNPELKKAVGSLQDAAQHVRNAVQGKIDEVRGGAAADLAKAKAAALRNTNAVHHKVEAVLTKAEARLHKMIAKAQAALDKAVREAEKRSAPAPAPRAAKGTAAKAPVRKAAKKTTAAK